MGFWGFERIEGPQQVAQILARLQGPHKQEIRLAVAETAPGFPLGRFGLRLEQGGRRVVGHADFGGQDAVGPHDVGLGGFRHGHQLLGSAGETGHEEVVVPPLQQAHIQREMLEGQVVHYRHAGHGGVQRRKAIGAEKRGGPVPGQPPRHRALKPRHEQQRMPRRRVQHVRHHVGPEQVAGVVAPVKQKMKRDLRVLGHQAGQRFEREAANTFQVGARQQKTSIDGNVHFSIRRLAS